MRPPWITGFVLRLYPRSYRARFGHEWVDAASWHWARVRGRSAPRLRYALALLLDAARAAPVAHARAVVHRLAEWRLRGAELRHAVRGLRRSPAYAVAAVASITIGVGVNTAVFSVVDSVLLRPLPYPESDRLSIVWNELPSGGDTRLPLSGAQVAELAEQPGLFEAVGGIWATSATLFADDGRTRSLTGGTVTPSFFSVLGVSPALGRDFDRDAGAGAPPPGVLISHDLWLSELGGRAEAVGSSIVLDGESVEVIGVLPADFALHFPPDGSIPVRLDVYWGLPWDLRFLPAGQRFLRVVGRLRPEVDGASAAAGVAAAGDRARTLHPELARSGDRLSTVPLHADATRAVRPALLVLLTGSFFFALLAAANVSSLALIRASARARELAVRTCLGGTRRQVARLLLTEAAVVGFVGGAAGMLLGWSAAGALWAMRPAGLAAVDVIRLDGTVLLFSAAVTLGSVLVFGVAPLLAVRRGAPIEALRGRVTGGRRGRAREAIVIGELAIGLVLVAGAGLLTQSLQRLAGAEVGFDRSAATTVRVPLPRSVFPEDVTRARLAREIEARLATLPGVSAVGGTSHVPFGSWANWAGTAPPAGTPEAEAGAYFFDHRSVTSGYLSAVGATLVEGRHFDAADEAGTEPVVIVDRSVAERAFPGTSAVGRTLVATRYVDGAFVGTDATVVGVVEPMRDVAPSVPGDGQLFWPFEQSARWELTWVVRHTGDVDVLLADAREAIAAVDGRLTAGPATTFEALFRVATARERFVALLGGALSVIALGLAALGLYGVMTQVAVQRLPELGLHAVLGARRNDLLRGVLLRGVKIGLLGIGFGLLGTLAVGRSLESLLYGVGARDPAVLAGVASTFLLVTVVASLRPALRAARVDPAEVLRGNG